MKGFITRLVNQVKKSNVTIAKSLSPAMPMPEVGVVHTRTQQKALQPPDRREKLKRYQKI